MKKAVTALLIIVVLLIGTISPALAGKVTVVNNSSNMMCEVMYKGYIFGNEKRFFIVAKPGKTEWNDDVFHSVGRIWTMCITMSFIKEFPSAETNMHSYYIDTSRGRGYPDYFVPGTWLPHRKFLVTIDSNGKSQFSEQ